jgi:hypothetical protein
MQSANVEIVNVGNYANDGSGDPLRTAMLKINRNFSNIYLNGRFLGNISDSKIAPGYSWPNAPRSGMYHSGLGLVGISVDGQEGLVIRNTGSITFNGTALVGGGLGLAKRISTYGNSSVISAGSYAFVDLDVAANTYAIGAVSTNIQSRIRVYIDPNVRTYDLARTQGVAYSSNAGIICDFSTPGYQSEIFSPALISWDVYGSKKVYVTVNNTSASSNTAQIGVSYLPLEL